MRKTATTLGNVIAKGKAQELTVAELKAALENPEECPDAEDVLTQMTYMSQNIKGSGQYFRFKGNQSQVAYSDFQGKIQIMNQVLHVSRHSMNMSG